MNATVCGYRTATTTVPSPSRSSPVGLSGQERERLGMTRSHDSEMTVIKRRHLDNVKPLGERHNRSVTAAQWKISVGVDEFCHPRVVLDGELDGPEITGSKRPQERRLSPRAPPGMQQVADLGNDRGWQHHRTPGKMHRSEQLDASVMVRVTGQTGRDQRTRVADQHLPAEPLGQDVLTVRTNAAAVARLDPEPSRWPRTHTRQAATQLSQRHRNLLVGQLLHQTGKLLTIALRAHVASLATDTQ